MVDELNGLTTTSSIHISNHKPERKLLSMTDIMGRETVEKNNSIVFYLYDDGSVEKIIIIE